MTNLRLIAGQFVNAGAPSLTFIEAARPWIVMDLQGNQLVNVQPGNSARILFDGVPGGPFEARVRDIAWGIDPGRTSANGLPVNQASNRWFEPARTIPVQLELLLDQEWPANVRAGSKASSVIFAGSQNRPVALIARGVQRLQSYLTYLY